MIFYSVFELKWAFRLNKAIFFVAYTAVVAVYIRYSQIRTDNELYPDKQQRMEH